jgi:hypothetical protein
MPGYTVKSTQRAAMTTFVKKTSFELPAGKYFIGPLGDFLHGDIYDSIWSAAFSRHDGAFAAGDHGFMVKSAALGNGSYVASNRYTYDGDNISIVSTALVDPELYMGCGTFHTFAEPVRMFERDGMIEFRSGSWSLTIDTTQSDDPDVDEGYDSFG